MGIVKDVDNAAARRFGLCLNTLDDLFVCLAYRITDVEVQYDGIFRSLTSVSYTHLTLPTKRIV